MHIRLGCAWRSAVGWVVGGHAIYRWQDVVSGYGAIVLFRMHSVMIVLRFMKLQGCELAPHQAKVCGVIGKR